MIAHSIPVIGTCTSRYISRVYAIVCVCMSVYVYELESLPKVCFYPPEVTFATNTVLEVVIVVVVTVVVAIEA